MYTLSNALNAFEEAIKRSDRVYFAFDINPHEFLYINPAVEQIWNKSMAEISSKPVNLLENVHPEDREYITQTYIEAVKGARKKDVEFRLNLPDGNTKWLCLQYSIVNDASGKRVIVGIIEDVTKLKEYNAVLEKYAARKDSILEILSHDLANPLTAIKGASSILNEQIKQYNDPTLEKMLDMIARTTERSIRLIREFVKQEFLESANTSLRKNRVNIVQKLNEMISQYKNSEKEIAKVFSLNVSNKKIFMAVDEYKFIQVIHNLISNSIKFTPDGGTISVGIEEKPEHVLFTVADNGIGIPAKYHEGLFEKFNKARRTGLKGEPSVGLGMSLIKTIVDWHNGRIWFESKENEGTTFYIEMPKA